jgi:hypothetical protein
MPNGRTRIGWIALLGLVGVSSLELTVRIDDWAQFGVPLDASEVALEELSIRDSLGVHARAGTQFRQFRINSLGFRGPDLPATLPAGTKVIVTSGASETFGLYERGGGEWPQQLRLQLARRCAQPIVVLNAAFAGMSLPTVRQDIARRILPLRPDAVVYYPTPMQYLEERLPEAAIPSLDPFTPPVRWRPRATPRFREAFKRAVPTPVLDFLRVVDTRRNRTEARVVVSSAVPMDRVDAFEEDLRGLVGDLKRAGLPAVLAVHQNRFADVSSLESQRYLRAWERFYPRYTGRTILQFDSVAAERTKRVAVDSAVLVVDARQALRSATVPVFADFSHFNDAGAAIVGGEVARELAPSLCGSGGRSTASESRQ